MNSPEPLSNTDLQAAVEELEKQYHDLNGLFAIALVVLTVLIASVGTCFIHIQMKIVGRQVDEQRAAVAKMTGDFQKFNEPLIRNFATALSGFASTNRDFQTILDKYRLALPNYLSGPARVMPAPAPAGTSAPAAGKTSQ